MLGGKHGSAGRKEQTLVAAGAPLVGDPEELMASGLFRQIEDWNSRLPNHMSSNTKGFPLESADELGGRA